MITLWVTFDTQSFDANAYAHIASGGVLLRAAGLLNLKWDEFSALEAAQALGLHGVEWDAVGDDTPGSLTCVLRYPAFSPAELEARLHEPFVVDYDISPAD